MVTVSESRAEEQARLVGNDPVRLRRRFTDALVANLTPVQADYFKKGAVYDFPNRRLLSADGQHALVWAVRPRPDEPPGPTNIQTTVGFVRFVKL